jgi:hypothetical protein
VTDEPDCASEIVREKTGSQCGGKVPFNQMIIFSENLKIVIRK